LWRIELCNLTPEISGREAIRWIDWLADNPSKENDVSDAATGKAVIMGRIEVVEVEGENFKHDLGLVIVFDSREAIRKALADGECKFVFGSQ
jgi:hypothetical protein